MNELQYTKAFQASIYKHQSMLPLQCMTAEEKDRCLFYAYPEQWDSTSTMYADMYT